MSSSHLFQVIHESIIVADKDDLLNLTQRVIFASELENFVFLAIQKFMKGQREHGGDLSDRDLNAEIDNEIIDLVIYRWHQRSLKK